MYKVITKDDKDSIALMSHFVRLHPRGHFLQSPQWAGVKHSWDWRGVLVYDAGKSIAGAISVLIRPLPLGMSLLYAPRGPVCNRNNKNIITELLTGVKAVAKACRAVLLYMDPDEPDTNQAFRAIMKEAGFTEKSSDGFDNIQPQHVFRLDMTGRTEEEILAGFSGKTRYNIRLAVRRGVEIRQFIGGDTIPDEAFTAFSRLMETTGKRDHFIVRDKDYFKRIFSSLGHSAVLCLACLDGEPIAGAIGIYYGGKAWYLYGASSNDHRGAMPNYLVQWELIRRALSLRCAVYDFRGVPGDVSENHPLYGLYRFKKGFSGDYVKFTGLFTYTFKRLPAAVFLLLLKLRRSRRIRQKSFRV